MARPAGGAGIAQDASSRPAEIAAVFRGFCDGRSREVGEVGGWVRAVVFGGNWRFADADAVVQDVLLRLLQICERGRVQDPESFQKFVWQVAKNVCVDAYHRQRRRDVEAGEEPEPERTAGDDDPHADAEQQERYRLALYIYQRLPETCRELWDWVYGQGLSAAAIGEKLGISTGNVRVRVHRCLEKGRGIFASIERGEVTP